MDLIKEIVNDFVAFFAKDLVAEIESQKEEIEKKLKRQEDWNEMADGLIEDLQKYRDTTIKTISRLYAVYKDFYSFIEIPFFNWEEDKSWEKKLYDYKYTTQDKRENIEVKLLGDFIVRTYPKVVEKTKKSFNILKQLVVKLQKETKKQRARIEYLENICKGHFIQID